MEKAGAVTRRLVSAVLVLAMVISLFASMTFVQAQAVSDDNVKSTIVKVMDGFKGTQLSDWMTSVYAKSNIVLGDSNYSFEKDSYISTTTAKLQSEMNDVNFTITEIERMTIGLTACGVDVKDIKNSDGKSPIDLILANKFAQGINSVAFGLVAIDSLAYDDNVNGDTAATLLTQKLVDAQHADGGWSLSGTTSDPDVTASVLLSFAEYKNMNIEIKAAVDRGINCLSKMMNSETGEFVSMGGANGNSPALVTIALSALGVDAATDSRFITQGGTSLLNVLLSYQKDAGFEYKHGEGVNQLATEQGVSALTAYMLMKQNKKSLYNFTSEDMKTVYVQIQGQDKPIIPLTTVRTGAFDLQQFVSTPFTQITGVTAAHAIIKALKTNNIDIGLGVMFGSLYISSVGNFPTNDPKYAMSGWMYKVNNSGTWNGISAQTLNDGDLVTLYFSYDYSVTRYSFFNQSTYYVDQGKPLQVNLKEYITNPVTWADELFPRADAELFITDLSTNETKSLKASGIPITTDKDGNASFTVYKSGLYRISAIDIDPNTGIPKLNDNSTDLIVRQTTNSNVSDINDASSWAKDAIISIIQNGLMQGVGDGKFEPLRNITRAEVIKTMLQFMRIDPTTGSGQIFSDVNPNDWFYDYVNTASARELILGKSATSFEPNTEMTREEFATVLVRALALDKIGEPVVNDINDASAYARESIETVVSNGIIVGTGDGMFQPKGKLNRQQVALILERLYNLYY